MERGYNKNRNSFRPERSENRNDSRGERTERRDQFTGGERREKREVNGNRNESQAGRSNDRYPARKSEGREPFQDRKPNRFSENREYKPRFEESEKRPSRKIILRNGENQGGGIKRPRVFQDRNAETPSTYRPRSNKPEFRERPFDRSSGFKRERPSITDKAKEELQKRHYSKKKILSHRLKNENEETELRLNRYISMGGVCSRRDADELIVTGRVKVNGVVVQTVGQKVRKKDSVEVDGEHIYPEKKIYLVLNKPKDFVTTVEDPLERKTVMSLVDKACKERIYPVGRLDRQTTGVLLFTNDGDLAKKLTHPKYDNKKIYHVFLDRPVNEEHLQAIADGVELEDGLIKADEINYASTDRTEIGIEIHSGKNRIVRRIFEHFGYQIIKLDRVYFVGITKKNIPRGKWRFLTSQEVNMLKVY